MHKRRVRTRSREPIGLRQVTRANGRLRNTPQLLVGHWWPLWEPRETDCPRTWELGFKVWIVLADISMTARHDCAEGRRRELRNLELNRHCFEHEQRAACPRRTCEERRQSATDRECKLTKRRIAQCVPSRQTFMWAAAAEGAREGGGNGPRSSFEIEERKNRGTLQCDGRVRHVEEI